MRRTVRTIPYRLSPEDFFKTDDYAKKPWRHHPPTDKQAALIKKFGEKVPDTKGEASDLITELLSKQTASKRIASSARQYLSSTGNQTEEESNEEEDQFWGDSSGQDWF